MLVPFSDIPHQFLTPLNVETKVNYTLDMKKFPGLSSDAPPALIIAPFTKQKTECTREGCCGPCDLSLQQQQQQQHCVYSSCARDQTTSGSLIDAQRDLYHLLDSYQLEYTGAETSRGNTLESLPFPSPLYRPELCLRSTTCSQDTQSLTPCRFSVKQDNTHRASRERTARKFMPYQIGKLRTTSTACAFDVGDRKMANTNRYQQGLNSISCVLNNIHHNSACLNYGGQHGPKSQRQSSYNSLDELKKLQYSCTYGCTCGYSYKNRDSVLDSGGRDVSRLKSVYNNCSYALPKNTGFTDFSSFYALQNSTLQKENYLPVPIHPVIG